MNSIRTKTTLLTVCAIVVTMSIAMFLGVVAIGNIGSSNSNQLLLLLCEAGEKDLDSYFESVEQSVEMVAAYVESDLHEMESDQAGQAGQAGQADRAEQQLEGHLERAKDMFARMARATNGVLTYYYRIDPSVSDTARGFWFVSADEGGFEERETTDIMLYDTGDTSRLVWFTVPKATGEPVWLPPYITENLDARVLSYNVPIYQGGRFIGVVGIEIDYSTMARLVDNITLYDDGYAFINDAEGAIVYHPRVDVTAMEAQPEVPAGLISDDTFIEYS